MSFAAQWRTRRTVVRGKQYLSCILQLNEKNEYFQKHFDDPLDRTSQPTLGRDSQFGKHCYNRLINSYLLSSSIMLCIIYYASSIMTCFIYHASSIMLCIIYYASSIQICYHYISCEKDSISNHLHQSTPSPLVLSQSLPTLRLNPSLP